VQRAAVLRAIERELGEDVPSSCREPAYRDQIIKAYPFHPELIDVLYERWGTIPEFQRTRGVLRLLADVIANLYQAKDNEALTQSASVNLGPAAVRGELGAASWKGGSRRNPAPGGGRGECRGS